MKLNKILTLTLLAASAMTSCNDLEQVPSNEFTDANFWTSPERAQYVVNMAYSQMYNAGRMWTDESLSDNMFDGRNVTDQRQIRRGMATPSLGVFSSEWSSLYGGLKTCHVFLNNIDLIENLDQDRKQRMIAEIRFVRAFIYLRLTNLYGAIPFFTSDITLDQANTISRTPASEVMAFIHTELDDIIDVLPTSDQLPEAENGKITRGAAVMLQARAYLMESDWDNVIKYTDMLINHQDEYGHYELFGSYAGLFKEENEYNCEVILDRAYVPTLITWGEMTDMAPLTAGARINARAPQQSLVDTYLMLSGKSINDPDTDYNPARPYDNRDPRLTATVVYDGYPWAANMGSGNEFIYTNPDGGTDDSYSGSNSNQSATGYYTAKYYSPQAVGDLNSGLNIIMMRYADVLLMYAEAKFETNAMTSTVWDETIGAIRRRAGFTAPAALNYPSGLSPTQMRQVIRNERRVELALEGLRWWDIKRWKAGKEYLDGYCYGATFNGNRITLDNRSFDEIRDYLWAVPQSQTNINRNLLPNNPGYSN